MSVLGKRSEAETPAASASADGKKPRWMNEDDLDFLIGDLTREESQLVLTRLTKSQPTIIEGLKDQINLVRHSRHSLSMEQLEQQVKSLQQLVTLRAAQLSAPVPPVGGDFPMMMPFAFGGAAAAGAGPMVFGGGGGGNADAFARQARNNIQQAFRKIKGLGRGIDRYTIETQPVDAEINKVKDQVLAGSQRNALAILEALTDEFTNKIAQLGETNVENHSDTLARFAREFLEVFLVEKSDLSEVERKEWSDQLRTWDTAGAEENGLFAPARWAVRNGWDNDLLKRVLSGEATEEKFFEHPLSIAARLNWLEREKKFQEALFLAQHCEMAQHQARFLVKLGRVEEAIESARSMTDARTVFTTAQLARSLDKNAAFTLSLRALAIDFAGWNKDNEERAVWLCELACEDKEGMLDRLVNEMTDHVKDKRIVAATAKHLLAKKRPREALVLAEKNLRPFSDDELSDLYVAQEKRRIAALPPAVAATEVITPLKVRAQLISSIPGSGVPSGFGAWMWESAFNTVKEGSTTERDAALEEHILSVLIAELDDYNEFVSLMNAMTTQRQFSSVRRIGDASVSLINRQYEKNRAYTDEITRENFVVTRLNAKEGVPTPIYTPPPPKGHHPVYRFDEVKLRICQMMIESAVQNKLLFQGEPMDETAEELAIRMGKLAEARRAIGEVSEMFLTKVADPASLVELARLMANKEEHRLSLKVSEKAHERTKALDAEREKRDVWVLELRTLQNEANVLTAQRVTLSADKLKRLRDLELDELLFLQSPAYAQQDIRHYANLHLRIANGAVENSVRSRQCQIADERVSTEELGAVVDLALSFIQDPTAISSLMQTARNQSQHEIVVQLGRRAVSRFQQLRTDLESRIPITAEIQLLDREQQQLLAEKKDLDADLIQKLADLKAASEKLPALPFYAKPSIDQYDKEIASVATTMVDATIQARNEAQIALDTPTLEDTEERRKQLQSAVQSATANIATIFTEVLTYLKSPRHVHELANTLATVAEAKHAVRACEVGQDIVRGEIRPSIESRIPLVAQLQILEAELKEAQVARQPFPADKMKSLRELQLEAAVHAQGPSHKRMSLSDAEAASRGLSSTMISALQMRRQAIVRSNRDLDEEEARPAPQSISGVVDPALVQQALAAAAENRKALREKNAAELAELDGYLEKAVARGVEHAQSPAALIEIGKLLGNSLFSDGDKASLARFVRVVSGVFDLTDKLDKTRIERLPAQERRLEIETESLDLSVQRKTLTPELAAELLQLQRADALQRLRPPHENFSADELVAIRGEAAVLILSQVGTLKKNLTDHLTYLVSRELRAEKSGGKDGDGDFVMIDLPAAAASSGGATSYKEDLRKLKKEREETQTRLSTAQTVLSEQFAATVEKVPCPDLLLKILAMCDDENAHKVAQRILENIDRELAPESERRQGPLAELVTMRGQKAELLKVLKTFSGAQDTRFKELIHLDFVWNNEPSYRQGNWQNHDSWRASALLSWLKTLLKAQEQALTDLEKMTLYQDAEGNPLAKPGVTKEELVAKLNRLQPAIDVALTQSQTHLKDPSALFQIATTLTSNKEFVRAASIAKVVINTATELDDQRVLAAKAERKLYAVLQYRADLAERRATPPASLTKDIVEAQEAVESLPVLRYGVKDVSPRAPVLDQIAVSENPAGVSVRVPDLSSRYKSTILEDLVGKAANQLLQSALTDLQQFEAQVEEDRLNSIPRSADTIESQRKSLAANVDEIAAFLSSRLASFNHVKTLIETVKPHQTRSDLVLKLAENVLDKIESMREAAEMRASENDRELAALRTEETTLKKQFKALAPEKEARMQELIIEDLQLDVEPGYTHLKIRDYDKTTFDCCQNVLRYVQGQLNTAQANVETAAANPRLLRRDSLIAESVIISEADDALTLANEQYAICVGYVTKFIHSTSNLVRIMSDLTGSHHYKHTLVVGDKAQQVLKEQLEIREAYDALESKQIDLKSKHVEGSKESAELIQVTADVEELRWKISDSAETIRGNILKVAESIMLAAEKEGSSEIMCAQSILVFKMTLDEQNFVKVKNIMEEKDARKWPEVRVELLKCLAEHDPFLPGSPITARQQVTLLLQQGCWKEAMTAFPPPPEATTGKGKYSLMGDLISLLELLWIEVEKQAPKETKKLLDVVEEYAKKEYMSFNTASLDRLLDVVQTRHPEFIPKLYNMGSEILLANITAKQYDQFATYLQTLRRRLVDDLNKKSQWEDFNASLRREHGRKKKLIQHLNIAGLD